MASTSQHPHDTRLLWACKQAHEADREDPLLGLRQAVFVRHARFQDMRLSVEQTGVLFATGSTNEPWSSAGLRRIVCTCHVARLRCRSATRSAHTLRVKVAVPRKDGEAPIR